MGGLRSVNSSISLNFFKIIDVTFFFSHFLPTRNENKIRIIFFLFLIFQDTLKPALLKLVRKNKNLKDLIAQRHSRGKEEGFQKGLIQAYDSLQSSLNDYFSGKDSVKDRPDLVS